MSRPRRPLGPQPGRLLAVMLRALIAELCEPRRYARAKEYARDDAVVDIEVRPRRVVGSVQGTRREPYIATIQVDGVDREELAAATAPGAPAGALNPLLPRPDELAVACTCPDSEPGRLCKHVAAVLLVLADELSIEPILLARWRSDPTGDMTEPTVSGQPTGEPPPGDTHLERLPARRLDEARPTHADGPDRAGWRSGPTESVGQRPGVRDPATDEPATRFDPLAGMFEVRRPLPELPSPQVFDLVRWLAGAATGEPAMADALLADCVAALELGDSS